jgi:ABC-type taurine transport system substrate-binding protein
MTIEFISMLSTAQSAAQTAGIERLFQLVGNLAGTDPQVMDNVDFDYAIDKYSDLLGNDPKIIRDPKTLAVIRQQRAVQQEQAQQLEMSRGYAENAKNLSQTELGGGKNALQAIAGG